MEEEQTF